MKGKIVLIPFPFTDFTTLKRRPALVNLERDYDVIAAFISSKIPDQLNKYTILVNKKHSEFELTGLKVDSAIYLDKLATIKKELILGELGELGSLLRKEVNERFKEIFRL